jgi:hypothetical protein
VKDPTWISLSDLNRLYQRSKTQIRKIALTLTACVFGYLLFQNPQFTTEASFKLGKGKVEQSIPFPNLLQTVDFVIQNKNASASLVLLSRNVLGRSIKELGLQAAISPKTTSFIKRPFHILLSELKLPFKEVSSFQFKNISYSGETTLTFYLRLLSPQTYEILNLKQEHLCFGQLKETISFETIHLTLENFPPIFSKEKLYLLKIHPLENILKSFKPLLSIKPSKLDPQVLTLKFTHPSRSLGTLFLNTLMQVYQDVLKEENQLMADVQIAYLQKKHQELNTKFDQEMEEHASYLKKNLGEQGFISLSQEIDMLAPPKEVYLSKLFETEFELARFESPTRTLASSRPHTLPQLEDISLKLKEATLALDLIKQNTPPKPKQDTLAFLLANVQKAKALFESTQQDGHKTELAVAKTKLENYLQDLISSLTVRQNTLQELSSESFASHFQGIDLNSAKNLYISYNTQLDSLEADLTQLAYLGEHLSNDNFNLSSIGNVLSGDVTSDMIHRASELELQLKDSITHSPKEHERLKDALKTQKNFLSSHLEHVQELKKIQLHLTKEKIKFLKQMIVDLLETEKKLLHEKLADLHHQMSDLPTKWCFENKLKFRNELTKDIMQGLTQVSESKQLASELYQADATPLDKAIPPHLSNYPFLILFSCITFFLSSLIAYLYYYLKALIEGFPVSSETLQSLGEPFSGTLSLYADIPFPEIRESDHETLRSLASFLEKKPNTIGLFLAACSDYSHNLAHILYSRGKRTLIIECDLTRIPSNEDIPGLHHYMSKMVETLPIRNHAFFDYVPSGFTASSTELFTQERFSTLIEELKTRYDFIFLINRSPLQSSQAIDLLSLIDVAVVSFEREPLDDLKKYSNWIRQKQNRYVTFVESEVKPFI